MGVMVHVHLALQERKERDYGTPLGASPAAASLPTIRPCHPCDSSHRIHKIDPRMSGENGTCCVVIYNTSGRAAP
jgi:hypothetical protein